VPWLIGLKTADKKPFKLVAVGGQQDGAHRLGDWRKAAANPAHSVTTLERQQGIKELAG
jgi:hypothetical protein